MTKQNFESILICVIAVNGTPRNNKLIKSIKKIFSNAEICVVDAVTPAMIPPRQLVKQKMESTHLLGRPVSAIEIAVMLSHRKCYEIFSRSEKRFALILEDDVVINNFEGSLEDILNKLDSSRPIIVTLYSPMWSVWKKTAYGLRAKYPPPYAAAYFINQRAVEVALDCNPVGIADWPTWASKIIFFLSNSFLLSTLENTSYLEKIRVRDKKNKLNKFYLLVNLSYKDIVSQVKYLFVYPLTWKVHKLYRYLSSGDSSNNRIESRF